MRRLTGLAIVAVLTSCSHAIDSPPPAVRLDEAEARVRAVPARNPNSGAVHEAAAYLASLRPTCQAAN